MAASSSSKTLEEELKDAGNRLLVPPSSTQELLNLLDEVEHLLSRVEQAPSKPTQDALLPTRKALIAHDLLRHSEIDVKVSVASCINEITRVTAPDAPYDDEHMEEIFKLSVMALEKLSLASGHCYTKAVSILHNIAAVKSCLLMLDLEFDELIVDMFQLFLNTIRSDHPHSVFSDMEIIMTLVMDESEEIALELLIPLLSSVKKENESVSPLSCKLGENVLKKCAAKLTPYLLPAVQFMRFDPSDFAEIVFSICQDGRKYLVAKDVAPDGAGSSRSGTNGVSSPDKSHRKRGRPSKNGRPRNQDGERGSLLVPKGDLMSPQEKGPHSAGIASIKESDMKAKPESGSRKNAVVKKDDVLCSDDEGKQEASGPQMDGRKHSKGTSASGKLLIKKYGGKKTFATGSCTKDEASKTKRKRKRIPHKEQPEEENYGEELVGCKIEVWWPLDRKFYEGAINTFDPIEKKHKVLYADGDEEMLDLSTERWKLVTKNNVAEQGQGTELPSSDALSDDMKMDSADASSVPSPSNEVDAGKPLWNFVTRIEKLSDGGGNVTWRCNFCNVVKKSSYTRVRGHLLNLPSSGVRPCEKITSKDVATMQRLDDEARMKK